MGEPGEPGGSGESAAADLTPSDLAEDDSSATSGAQNQPSDGEAQRRPVDRRMLDEIFGDVLPDTTGDERDVSPGGGGFSEDWYRDNRPPHHGG